MADCVLTERGTEDLFEPGITQGGSRLRKSRRELAVDWLAGLLWGLLAVAYLQIAITQFSLSHGGLFLFYGLLSFNFVIRRPARRTGIWWEWLLGMVAVAYPLAVTGSGATTDWSALGLVLQGCGLVAMVIAIACLGRSFGIAAADRGLVSHGMYRLVRHPLYASELLYSLGSLLTCFSWRNLAAYFVLLAIQVIRIQREERIIAGYSSYAGNVRWRLVPLIW